MNTTSPNSRYAKFLSQFPFAVEKPRQDVGNGSKPELMNHVRWTGKVGYLELGTISGAIARIELSDWGSQGTYMGFRVDVISRVNGKLDSMQFEFNDILDPKDRTDGREKDHASFHGWSSGSGKSEIDWYIAKPSPKNVKHFVAAVNEYLTMWRGSDLS
jgi:hypothetical protein